MTRRKFIGQWLLAFILVLMLPGCLPPGATPPLAQPGLKTQELAVIVNQADPLSVKIAHYYQAQRHIPPENLIAVNFAPHRTTLTPEEFQTLKAQVDAKTPARVQGYALTWAAPYQVGCMSITAAFAFGFAPQYCATGCHLTAINPYFNQDSLKPFDDFKVRPTIALAATTFAQAKALIDRGVVADNTQPTGTAYLLKTSDKARDVRSQFYADIQRLLSGQFSIQVMTRDALAQKPDVMFYFTGVTQVNDLPTNRFLPGAIGDHLTSFGGMLTNSSQMSSLRWLEAGATGSYGTVVEPCNFPQKFPHPGVVMSYYLKGNTLLQAYWKSVQRPGQGIFIGEPLAQPFIK